MTDELVSLRRESMIPKQGALSLAAAKLGAFPSAYSVAESWSPSLRRDLEETARFIGPGVSTASMEAIQLASCKAYSSLLQFRGCQAPRAIPYAESVRVH